MTPAAGTLRVEANEGRALLPAQLRLLREKPNAQTRAIFGGWGSGKTMGAALAFLDNVCANPWTPSYGANRPFSVVIGRTRSVLMDSGYRVFRSICPPAAILREWRAPEWKMLMANGHEIVWRTWEGAIEGQNACTVWPDEAHQIKSKRDLLNFLARARDPLARRCRTIVSGLPESGLLQDTFEPKEHEPGWLVLHAASRENIYLSQEYHRTMTSACSAREAKKYLGGEWLPPENAIFYEYTNEHLVDDDGRRGQAVQLGMDLGQQAAVVFLQEREWRQKDELGRDRKVAGYVVVGELLPDRCSAEEVARLAQREAEVNGWVISPSRSVAIVDPTTDDDEMSAIQRALPVDLTVIRKPKADPGYYVEHGVRCVNVALRDATGIVRLRFRRDLPRTPRSVLTGLVKYRRDPRGKIVKDNTIDHAMDALRVIVAHLLPQDSMEVRVYKP